LEKDERMFQKGSKVSYKPALDGIQQKTLVYGERTLMTELKLAAGSILPLHSHPHEQTGYLVSGKLRLFVGEDEYNAQAGDSWCVDSNLLHGAEALEEAVAVEVFSPPKRDYIPG
jgi:quercetin dioxygenase-like cupin family protein